MRWGWTSWSCLLCNLKVLIGCELRHQDKVASTSIWSEVASTSIFENFGYSLSVGNMSILVQSKGRRATKNFIPESLSIRNISSTITLPQLLSYCNHACTQVSQINNICKNASFLKTGSHHKLQKEVNKMHGLPYMY